MLQFKNEATAADEPGNQPYSLPLQTFVKQWVILKISQNLIEVM